MDGMPTVLEFIEKNYALIVREEDKELLIDLLDSYKIKYHECIIRDHYTPFYVDFYVEEIAIMSKEFYQGEDYTFIEAADFLAANGFDKASEPVEPIGDETLALIL